MQLTLFSASDKLDVKILSTLKTIKSLSKSFRYLDCLYYHAELDPKDPFSIILSHLHDLKVQYVGVCTTLNALSSQKPLKELKMDESNLLSEFNTQIKPENIVVRYDEDIVANRVMYILDETKTIMGHCTNIVDEGYDKKKNDDHLDLLFYLIRVFKRIQRISGNIKQYDIQSSKR
jgi:hypothetical protein